MEEPDPETWTAWFLDAIRKIRSQKQRPSVERIAHAIRLQHDFHEEVIAENLQLAVKRGDVLKLFNKGQSSYKDPGGLQSKPLKVGRNSDLTKVIIKAVRELGERDGSNLKSIERYVRQSHTVEEEQDGDLKLSLRLSSKRAVDRGHVLQEGRLFRQPDRPIHLAKKFNTDNVHDNLSSKLFDKLSANAVKYLLTSSSQANESLDNSMSSHCPKSKSQSSDFRFAVTVAHKNRREGFSVDTMDKAGIKYSSNLVEHIKKTDAKALKRKQKYEQPEQKAKRKRNTAKKEQLRNGKEKSEVSHSSNMAFFGSAEKINFITETSDSVSYNTDDIAFVFIDLET
ncbi:uncharacterized protein LOC111643804 [Copidosoma floridanum]|uniref:uncharacterized protein LOC111643804 n=1 Tax=Copidosoma floridanum TaxID=29053 RepID=UPI000C6F4A9D|nr:uncharacterized protein LOC111643804 [Copidosoma floridanum]